MSMPRILRSVLKCCQEQQSPKFTVTPEESDMHKWVVVFYYEEGEADFREVCVPFHYCKRNREPHNQNASWVFPCVFLGGGVQHRALPSPAKKPSFIARLLNGIYPFFSP